MAGWGLCRRRSCFVPTLRGWVLIGTLLIALTAAFVLGLYPFLAQTHPFSTGPVVVEGWASRDTLVAAIAEHREHREPILYVTGGTLGEDIAGITGVNNFADLGAMRLRQLGMTETGVQPVPAPDVLKDRTYSAGLALRQWLEVHGGIPSHLTLVSEGPHARRSRMLFQQAFGRTAQIGILAATDWNQRGHRWWTYSQGFRSVVDEFIAWLYATVLFWRSGA